AVVRELRNALERRGFLEVETPMLQTLHGGAAARPFVTTLECARHRPVPAHRAGAVLKRCVVGGIEKVFEINRNFRNEGVDSTHSPSSRCSRRTRPTALRRLREDDPRARPGSRAGGVRHAVVTLADGTEYDLSGEWKTMERIRRLSAAIASTSLPTPRSRNCWRWPSGWDSGPEGQGPRPRKLVEELWSTSAVISCSSRPSWRNFPVETSPLTRQHRSLPGVTEKWICTVPRIRAGHRLLRAGRSRSFSASVSWISARLASAGDDEAMVLDEEFLAAMDRVFLRPLEQYGNRSSAHGADRIGNPGNDPVPNCPAFRALTGGFILIPC
nr:hypothetical protein [Prescottella equi]